MPSITENISIIKTQTAVLDNLIPQARSAIAAISAAEAEIRRSRPASEPSKAFQERLGLVAVDRIQQPTIEGQPALASLAASAWKDVV